jgi:hypothetical protein
LQLITAAAPETESARKGLILQERKTGQSGSELWMVGEIQSIRIALIRKS